MPKKHAHSKNWWHRIGYVAILDDLPVGTRYKLCPSGGLFEVGKDYGGHYTKVVVFVAE